MSGHNAKKTWPCFNCLLPRLCGKSKFTQMTTMWSCTTRNSQTKKQLDHDEKRISWTDVIFTSHNLAKYLLTPRDPGSGSRPAWSQRQPGMPFHLWTRASWPALQCLPHPGKENVLSLIERKKLGKSPLAISTILHLMWLAVKNCSKGVQGGEGGFHDVFPLILFPLAPACHASIFEVPRSEAELSRGALHRLCHGP